MSDTASVNTKSTYLSNATGVSRASARSLGSSRRNNMSKADWRVVVRDSFAALFDMVGDWAYLYAIFHRDYDGDGNVDTYLLGKSFDYETVIRVVFLFCILSTTLSAWTIATSLARKCGKNSLFCNCTVPRLAMAGIVFEDLPQFILTAYIDFTFSGGITPAGMLNICSSLTSLVNRVTTRYDDIIQEDHFDQTELTTVYEKMGGEL